MDLTSVSTPTLTDSSTEHSHPVLLSNDVSAHFNFGSQNSTFIQPNHTVDYYATVSGNPFFVDTTPYDPNCFGIQSAFGSY
jgi:hypothetical protein